MSKIKQSSAKRRPVAENIKPSRSLGRISMDKVNNHLPFIAGTAKYEPLPSR
jgi:hypothetical protein